MREEIPSDAGENPGGPNRLTGILFHGRCGLFCFAVPLLLVADCDILIPTALENQITYRHSDRLKARITN